MGAHVLPTIQQARRFRGNDEKETIESPRGEAVAEATAQPLRSRKKPLLFVPVVATCGQSAPESLTSSHTPLTALIGSARI